MGKYADTQIIESDKELKNLMTKYKEERPRKRIRMLIHLKSKTYTTRAELAIGLDIGKRTLERWIQTYITEGVESLLAPITRCRDSEFITKEIHEALEKRLNSPHDTFISYVEIQSWLNSEFDCSIKYDNLYYYLKRHYKTKLKVPRKSHIGKDEQAVAFFKNAE